MNFSTHDRTNEQHHPLHGAKSRDCGLSSFIVLEKSMWSSMQGHLLALRHEYFWWWPCESPIEDSIATSVAKGKGFTTVLLVSLEAGKSLRPKGVRVCSQENRSQGSLLCTCQEHLLMERMFYKEETGMHWSTTGPFPMYLSLLVSSTPHVAVYYSHKLCGSNTGEKWKYRPSYSTWEATTTCSPCLVMRSLVSFETVLHKLKTWTNK